VSVAAKIGSHEKTAATRNRHWGDHLHDRGRSTRGHMGVRGRGAGGEDSAAVGDRGPAAHSIGAQTDGRTDESSCLWYRGKIRWCLSGWDDPDDEWYISQYPEPEHRGRYYFQDHRDRVLGYLRPTSYGYRAMVSVCPKGPQPCGWARGGRIVRTGRRNEFYVYSRGNARGVQGCVFTRCDGLPRREVARGTHAIAIALYKFVLGDCQEAWTQKPCGT
jgi:hypothetical protein